MIIQDAFETLLCQDLDCTNDDLHELDVLLEVVRHEVVAFDVHALAVVDRVLDLLGRFALGLPLPLTLFDAICDDNLVVADELDWVPAALLDILALSRVVEPHLPAWGLLTIPLSTATWAQGWSARMRRDDVHPGLAADVMVRDRLIDCGIALLQAALRERDTLLVLDMLPHAEYWLRQHASTLDPQRYLRLGQIVQQARSHVQRGCTP